MEQPESNGAEERASGSLERMVSRPREITPDDVTKEADRNYDLGRKHAKEELTETTIKPLVSALEGMLLASSKLRLRVNHHAVVVTKFSEWDELTEAMRNGERMVKSANASDQRPATKTP